MSQEELELTRVNPLAAEQLKSIVLRRKLAEAERKLAQAAGPKNPDTCNGEETTEAGGG